MERERDGKRIREAHRSAFVPATTRWPGDSFSLPYFAVSDISEALESVQALGGSVVHPGEQWAVCKDSEGSPFGLAQEPLRA